MRKPEIKLPRGGHIQNPKDLTPNYERICLKINYEQKNGKKAIWVNKFMAFFNSAVTVLQTLVIALGAGLGIWGAINLLEGYGNDNPGAKSQGMKQLMAGGGVALIGTTLVPLLSGLFG